MAVPCWAWMLLACIVVAWAFLVGVALVGLGYYLGSGGSILERIPVVGTVWRWVDLHFYRSFDVWVLQAFGVKLFDAGAITHAQGLLTKGTEQVGAVFSAVVSAIVARTR